MGEIAPVIVGALVLACAGACGIALATLVCCNLERLEDGPPAQPARPVALIVCAALLGMIFGLRHAQPMQIALAAAVTVPLAAAWYSDSRKGIIPDWFTLGPLAIVAIYVIVAHAWWVGISALVLFVPFAIAAMISRGRGMGWGDVKLVAFGGALLGMQSALLVFALACFAATAVSVLRDRGKTPIAFGPYLVTAVAIGVGFPVHG